MKDIVGIILAIAIALGALPIIVFTILIIVSVIQVLGG